ncbi:bifunctional protein-serine/threonine kinase/phosphatase [Pseudomonas profundi]|uniref:bifunctional protein-serine/threonine kinase/phosphatase n=1 Tax=Pseudomonas profundi TaxID=1981513 RepID=UPI001CC23856|nr:bifunctional protein-serine/threonine kinase/phosphatase [Pseudomonas profundi]
MGVTQSCLRLGRDQAPGPGHLRIAVGQYSDKGRKQTNQDFHGLCIPCEPLLSSKGIAIALADGISSSDVSHIASQSAVASFLEDYYCTAETWSVKKSVQRVLAATNSWLYAQTRQSQYRYDLDRGYVCTFSAMVVKSRTAHLFHVGDARIYRVQGNALEQLTEDHRMRVSADKSYLSRALGIDAWLDIDYRTLQVEVGDTFMLLTDGVYEHASSRFMLAAIAANPLDLDLAAQRMVEEALEQGSDDNLTAQIIRIEELPDQAADELHQRLTELPPPPILQPGEVFDGYRIIREVHASSRSHVYLAEDEQEPGFIVLKTPSTDLRDDSAYLERFLTEEWIARRIRSNHVLKPCPINRPRNYLYTLTEYIEGQTLAQWMLDNPTPDVETVRGIVEQIAKGLQAFHRAEMLHQDLRPENIMIDSSGTVKIIDFGSAKVAGLAEITAAVQHNDILGTAQYTAPEYFLGESGTPLSDMFSLAVITYQMLTGKLPYGAEVAKCRTRAAQNKLKYQSVLDDNREIPAWLDEVLRKALQPSPNKRYTELSEFAFELRRPSRELANRARPPLIKRNPVLVWQWISAVLLVVIILLLMR